MANTASGRHRRTDDSDERGPVIDEPGARPRAVEPEGAAGAGNEGPGAGEKSPESGPGERRRPAARAERLEKHYGEGEAKVTALAGVDVELAAGEFTAIMGPSGSGKSTLMHCLAGLDRPSSGEVYIGETPLSGMSDREATELRRDRLGFIFQSFNLVPSLSAAENITLPSDIAGRRVDKDFFVEVTERLGLAGRLDHRPSELSGGQQQRVACARALVARPELVFGDEPTGSLDSNSSKEVLGILRSAVDDDGQTVVVVTHDPSVAARADRVLFLTDGRIVEELTEPGLEAISRVMTDIERS
ncbi:ABC transporter ATP-binding protein [Corynebacterium otitidis]|uniref:ABC transporter domain-containing protein n=1 Tax=Corynebacterium otitidis ATCC 51513 TaxID=883169 RepID=K0YGL8_9CORY|nr:ABC transporter ATP-binding protein [Corynebacterium otitidis]EJZ82531.1 hypothetical protein HMPREF9719_00519 [Corynebacterium otitidis ATCC 51513]